MPVRQRRPGGAPPLALLLLLTAAAPASAQRARTFTACTPDALVVCAEFRLTPGPGSFELALRTVGAASAALPLSLYNVVFATGAPAAATPRTTLLGPTAVGGATVTDARPWELSDTGDALFVSALTNRGLGGCASGLDMGGFGQAARTCGPGQFITFTFTPSSAFIPENFALLGLEAVGLTASLPAASCGAPGAACVITADAVVPEPGPGALVAGGLAVLAGAFARRAGRHGRTTA